MSDPTPLPETIEDVPGEAVGDEPAAPDQFPYPDVDPETGVVPEEEDPAQEWVVGDE